MDSDRGGIVFSDFPGIDIHVDQLCGRNVERHVGCIRARCLVAEGRAYREKDVGFKRELVGYQAAYIPRRENVELVILGETSLRIAPKSSSYGCSQKFCNPHEFFLCVRHYYAPADQD